MSDHVLAFISKLWVMVNNRKYDHLIKWSDDGKRFVIKDPVKFASELLPIYYKHNNMASFIRQLNKYGFKKIVTVESASLKNEKSELEFFNSLFMRDSPGLLPAIKRRESANNKEVSYPTVMVQLAKEVQQLQQKQNIFESKLRTMKNENTALWREHSILRHKHQNLQKLLNKLIQFILTLVQQTRGLNIKHVNIPLMLKNRSEGLAAIKDHSYQRTPSTSEKDTVSEVLDNTVDARLLPQIFNSTSSNTPSIVVNKNKPPANKSVSVVAVPLQEVSPAIVYGKPVGTSKGSEGRSLLVNNKNKRKQLADIRPKKILKPNPPGDATKSTALGIPVYVKKGSVTPTTSQTRPNMTKSSELDHASLPQKIIYVQSPNVGKAGKIEYEGLPEGTSIQVLPQEVTNTVTSGSQDVCSPEEVVDDILSIPTILSPSGTQLSPAILEVENDDDAKEEPEVVTTSSLEPLQKDIDNHIGTIQSDLDILKDLLQGEGLSIDASTLFGLLNEDPLALNMPEALGLPADNTVNGNELISYDTPNLLDIVESLEDNDVPEYVESSYSVGTPTLNTPKPEFYFDLPSSSKSMKK